METPLSVLVTDVSTLSGVAAAFILAIGLAFLTIASHRRAPFSIHGWWSYSVTALAFIAIILLSINVVGVAQSPSGPVETKHSIFEDDSTLSYSDARERLSRPPDDSDGEYLERATMTFNQRIAHTWHTVPSVEDEERVSRELRFSPTLSQNYLLWGMSHVDSVPVGQQKYRSHEYLSWQHALRRGVGLCSQHAKALGDFLDERGYEGSYVGLHGHVVLEVEADGQHYVADADYGVVIPHSIEYLRENPSVVRQYYTEPVDRLKPRYREGMVDKIVSIYVDSEPYHRPLDSLGNTETEAIEEQAVVWKWLLPVLLFVPAGVRRMFLE